MKNNPESDTSKKRIRWIDIAKGLAMILIVFSHTKAYGELPGRHIYFPLINFFYVLPFFVLSGMFFKESGVGRRILKLAIAWLSFNIIYWIAYIIGQKLIHLPINWNSFLTPFLGGGANNGPLWFIESLITITAIFTLIVRFIKSRYVRVALSVAIGLGGYFLDHFDLTNIYYIGTSMSSLPFFVLGYEFSAGIKKTISPWWFPIGLAAMIILYLITPWGLTSFNNVYQSSYIIAVLKIIAGTVAIFGLASVLDRYASSWINWIFVFVGEYSLIILGTHFIFLRIPDVIFQKMPNLAGCVIGLLVILAIEVPICIIIKRYFPFLIGEKRRHRP